MSYLATSKLSRRCIHNRKRILIVNCYFDYTRRPVRRPLKVPQAMAPVYLAGTFSAELCDIYIYNEQFSGPLEDEHLLSWPDMLVMTGLTSAFDRMLHLTAYARTKNANVIVVAGRSPVRAIHNYSRRFFDYCCCGDIEEMGEVIANAFGEDYVAREILPRYDLAYYTRGIGYIETSRNGNFSCPFCVLTGEGVKYHKLALNSSLLLCAERLVTSCGWINAQHRQAAKRRHTHISTKEPLDGTYKPAFRVDSCLISRFISIIIMSAIAMWRNKCASFQKLL